MTQNDWSSHASHCMELEPRPCLIKSRGVLLFTPIFISFDLNQVKVRRAMHITYITSCTSIYMVWKSPVQSAASIHQHFTGALGFPGLLVLGGRGTILSFLERYAPRKVPSSRCFRKARSKYRELKSGGRLIRTQAFSCCRVVPPRVSISSN